MTEEVKMGQERQWHKQLRLLYHYFVYTTFWYHLRSTTERTHGSMKSICWKDIRSWLHFMPFTWLSNVNELNIHCALLIFNCYSHRIYPISDTSTLTKIYHRTHTLLKWNISSHLKGLTVVILEKKNWPHIHRYIWSEQLANTTRRQHTPDETSNQSHQSPLPWK